MRMDQVPELCYICVLCPEVVLIIIIINNTFLIVVVSVVLYLTNKGEHAALYKYKLNNNVYLKTSKIIDYVIIMLYSVYTCTHFTILAYPKMLARVSSVVCKCN